jgi:hypothetical protein
MTAELPGLPELDLIAPDRRMLELLPQLSRLTHLMIYGHLPSENLRLLMQLTTLRNLHMESVRIMCLPEPCTPIISLIASKGFTQLRSLELCCDASATSELGQLTFLSRLKCLMVNKALGSIKPLTALSRLRDLQLEYLGSRDRAADPSEWHHLSSLTALTCLRLELEGCMLNCSGLSRLATLTNLQDLALCTLGGPIPDPDGGTGPGGLPPALAILGTARKLQSLELNLMDSLWVDMGLGGQAAVGLAMGHLPHLTRLHFQLGDSFGKHDRQNVAVTPLFVGFDGVRSSRSTILGAEAGGSADTPPEEGMAPPKLQVLSLRGVHTSSEGEARLLLACIAQLTCLHSLTLHLELPEPLEPSQVVRTRPSL